MQVNATRLPGVVEIVPRRFEDERGSFSETYNADRFAAAGLPTNWVQDNHATSRHAGIIRGLHYQLPPAAQDKLIRVVRGSIFDVAVDIRKGSPHYGRWAGVELSARRGNQLLVPKGFLHGYLTLEPDTDVTYKVTAPYAPALDRAVRYDDPAIGIEWPLAGAAPILSDKDRNAPLLSRADNLFEFDAGSAPQGRN